MIEPNRVTSGFENTLGELVFQRLQISDSPVALPGMSYIIVCDGVFVSLLVQKVKHILDGQGQRATSVGCAEDGLKQVVHKLL